MFFPPTGTKKQRCVQLFNAVAGTGTLNYFPISGPYNTHTSVKCVCMYIYMYTHTNTHACIYTYIHISIIYNTSNIYNGYWILFEQVLGLKVTHYEEYCLSLFSMYLTLY